jgi:hypothetical protein
MDNIQGIVLVSLIFIVGLYFLTARKQRKPLNMPPVVGPGWYENVAKLTEIKGTEAVDHILRLSESIKDFGKTSCGSVFRISMVGAQHFVVADYKLARILMEGNREMNIPESEKTTIGKNFDIYDDIGNIFS